MFRTPTLIRPPADSSLDPGRLSLWTEFHDQVEKLPDFNLFLGSEAAS